jgi:hypothetical protein
VGDLHLRSNQKSSALPQIFHGAFIDEPTAVYPRVGRTITTLILASIGVVILNAVAEIHEEWSTTFDMFITAIILAFICKGFLYLCFSQ